MFSLCKTVKIYNTINHHHSQSRPQEPHQLNFQEHSPHQDEPLSHNSTTPTVDSHRSTPRKSRTGINLSIRESSASPSKISQHTHDNNDLSLINNRLTANSLGLASQFPSIRVKEADRMERDCPQIIESKITYQEMSPRITARQSEDLFERIPLWQERELVLLNDPPLERKITRTTQHSLHSSKHKVDSKSDPMKKSTTFIRSSSRSKIDECLRNSIQSSIKNSIDLKLSTSRIKREDASESLLRLSCSSNTEIFDRPNINVNYLDFSHSCSLELKREESSYLKEYVVDVNESIEIITPVYGKNLKVVRSNNDLLRQQQQSQFKQSQSNILQRQGESPVKKLKKRYGDSLLHPYDKDTIVSKSFASRSNYGNKIHVIDESVIVEHQLQNNFIPLEGRQVNRQFFRMYLAVQTTAKLLVSIKEVPISCIDRVTKELAVYRQIESHSLDVAVTRLYQMYTHGNIFLLVKEPYELTLQQFINKHAKEYVLVSWEFIAKNIEETLQKTLRTMKSKHLYPTRPISTEDIVYSFGDWKIHSPDLFGLADPSASLDVQQALLYLQEQFLGRIRQCAG